MNQKSCNKVSSTFREDKDSRIAKRNVLSLFLIGFLCLTFFMGIVAADPTTNPDQIRQNIGSMIDSVTAIVSPVANAVLGTSYDSSTQISGDYLFARVLFFIIILTVVYLSLEQVSFFRNSSTAMWTVSIIVAVLGVRFIISDSWIQAILLPYQTFAVAITAGLPFVLYFLIVNVGMKDSYPFARKVAWIFFGVIFTGLYFTRVNGVDPTALWIYPITALLALIMIMADGTIHRFWADVELKNSKVDSAAYGIRKIKLDQMDIDKLFQAGKITQPEYIKATKRLEERIKVYNKLSA